MVMKINVAPISLTVCLTAIFMASESFAFRADGEVSAGMAKDRTFAALASVPQKMPTAEQKEAADFLDGAKVEWDAKTGAPASIRGKYLSVKNLGGPGMAFNTGRSFASDAFAVMDRLAKIYRLRDAAEEFRVFKTEADDLGFHHVRMNQVYQGLRVVGGQLVVHFDNSGDAYQVNGRYIPGIELEPETVIDEESAFESAQRDLVKMGKPAGKLTGGVELVIYARDVSPVLAYEFMLVYDNETSGAGRWLYWVNASDGVVINRFNDVRKAAATVTGTILTGEGGQTNTITGDNTSTNYYLFNTNRHWKIYNYATTGYVDNDRIAQRGSNDWGTSDRTEMSAAYNFSLIQTYYYNNHSRNSFDNYGAEAIANVHDLDDTDNAFWDPTTQQFYFYPGSALAELTVLDVCAHEFTHAVTEHSANLVYQNEPGALNESFSDIFGAVIEFNAQPDGRAVYPNRTAGYADWLMGEDCSYPYAVAMRDMRNPQRFDNPSKYHGTDWYYGAGDNGGVHYNSGVQNHFFYLLSDGGSGTNDGLAYDITGIGVSNAARVAYRALTVYCSVNTDYAAVLTAWNSAAQDLDASWLGSIGAAWAAVGMYIYSAPSGIAASAGTYSNKVHLTWSAVSGATNYYIYRDTSTNASSASLLASTTALSYDDLAVSPGVVYYYWLKAVGASGSSDYSVIVYGSSQFPVPTGLSATQGTSADSVQLRWNASSGATGYIIYRNVRNSSNAASEVARSSSLSCDESSAIPGTLYYYWIKSYSVVATSSFSSVASGYRALPVPGGVSASGGAYASGVLVSWSGVSGAISYRIWRNTSADSSSAINLGETADTSFLDTSSAPGIIYYYWVQSKKWSLLSSLSGSASGWRRSMAAGNNARGDFDGDGIMDFAVYQESTGMWYVRLSGSGYTTVSSQLGSPGFTPVSCDYDGDGHTDATVYYEPDGLWIVLLSSAGNAPAYAVLGGNGFKPVAGDFDGDGRADGAVYQESTGTWKALLSKSNYNFVRFVYGGPGCKPAAADYDGDGLVDPAVYYEVPGSNLGQNVGSWYIALSGSGYTTSIKTSTGVGLVPVPADYDGDGKADLATYNSASGVWNYWSSVSSYPLPISFTLGGAGYAAVPADYDGDTRADIAVYHEATGQWYFLLSSQNYASSYGELGGSGYEAVGARR